MRSFLSRVSHIVRDSAALATAATVAVSAVSTGAILGIAGGRLGEVDDNGSARPASTGIVWSPPIALSIAASEATAVVTKEGTTSVLAVKTNKSTNLGGNQTPAQAPILGSSAAPGNAVGAAAHAPVAQAAAAGVGDDKAKAASGNSVKKAKGSNKKAKGPSKNAQKSALDSDKKTKKGSGGSDKRAKKHSKDSD